MTNAGSQVYGFGPFRLDREERVLLRDGQPVPLRPKDFDMLLVLVEHSGRVIDKDELMKRVWPETYVEEANLSHHVFTLRKALGDDKDGTRYIETVPRRGYRFVLPVTREPTAESPAGEAPSAPSARPHRRRKWTAAALAAAVVGAGVGWLMLTPAPSPPITRLAIPMATGDRLTTDSPSSALAVSPDGTRVVYAANGRLYLRPLDRLEATPIPGVERAGLASARAPFFSPDGQWIGFWEERHLKKVSIHGGAPIVICELGPPPFGAAWAADGSILIGRGGRGVWRVSADGGTPASVITVENGQFAHGPQLLPDGRSVLFTLATGVNWDEAQIVVQSLDTGARRTIASGSDARYVPTGHVVYALRDMVQAVRFNASTLSVSGPPVVLVERVRRRDGAFASAVQLAVSSGGTLAYLEARQTAAARRTLVWVDRRGREEVLPVEPRAYIYPRISPDGGRLALDIQDGQRDVWVWDFSRRTLTRVTSDPTRDVEPLWTTDGQRLVFLSLRTGIGNLFWQPADGGGVAEQLTVGARIRGADAITPDGKFLVVRELDGKGGWDLALLALPPADRVEPAASGSHPLVQSPHAESNAAISPDARWLAYQSDSSGSMEIYLRTLHDQQRQQWQVSTAGGTEPAWGPDSRELFYRSPSGAVMRVAIAPASASPVSAPTQLFDGAAYVLGGRGEFAGLLRRTYDVSRDGRRFLMIRDPNPQPPRPPERIIVVQNWMAELKAKLSSAP